MQSEHGWDINLANKIEWEGITGLQTAVLVISVKPFVRTIIVPNLVCSNNQSKKMNINNLPKYI